MILILSHEDDPHVSFVRPRLDRLGAPYRVVDPWHFPADMAISYRVADGQACGEIVLAGESLPLDSIRSVWWRRPGVPRAASTIKDPEQRANIDEMAGLALADVWENLHCQWVPCQPGARVLASHKMRQIQIARRIGFATPETLLTNDPAALLAFYGTHHGQVVTKSTTSLVSSSGNRFTTQTRLVTRRSLRRIAAVRHAPVIAQPRVKKAFELRITVIGADIHSARINSGTSPRAGSDWRTAYEFITFERHELPSDVARRCRRLIAVMGLTFGAIDLVVTPAGEHVFLEVNPSGQWGFMPGISADIADSIAALLVRGTTEGAAQ